MDNMNSAYLKYIILMFVTLRVSAVFGGVEPAESSTLDGKYFIQYTNASTGLNPNYNASAAFTNFLPSFNSTGTYSFPTAHHVRRIDNMVELNLDPIATEYIAFAYTLEVTVQIQKYEPGATAPSIESAILKIEYDPAERTKWIEKANFHFTNAGRVNYTIQSVTLSPSSLTEVQKEAVSKVVGLRSDIIIERYKDFNPSLCLIGTNIQNAYDPVEQELTIKWHTQPGAEYYDLEWAYVDDYNLSGPVPPGQLVLNKHYNLMRNSTRIQTSELKYTFPLVYERGYILYRVRAVGMEYETTSDSVFIIPGRWSNPVNLSFTGPDQAPTVQTWMHKYHIQNAYEGDNFNWQITTTYAEEGKSKSIVGFRDGTDRVRQTITGLSTENETMVAEKIYDHQGRAAIEVLPVPANDPALKYFKHFNKPSSNASYNRSNFDFDRGTCDLFADPMATSSGASRYYSSNNPKQQNENAYIPDSQGYPFIQTEYTPDNTGRISRQSGVGLDHRLGSTHETKYFYGTPVQEELSMLFGVEVGDADHYKKNVVQDPNGQLSVSYLDLKGKVIATALAGNPPTNLEPLASYDSMQMDVDLMVFNQKDSLTNELTASRSFTVTHKSKYTFSYTMSSKAYTAALCSGINLCFDCVYDLEIAVVNICNDTLYKDSIQLKPLQFDANDSLIVNDACPKNLLSLALSSNSYLPQVVLPVGSYTVTKTLKVNQAATDAYVLHYMTRFEKECKSVYDKMLQNYLSKVDTLACEIKDSTKTLNRCEVAREGMLVDMSPGGQYGLVDWSAQPDTATDPLSVFNRRNYLPVSLNTTTYYNWKNPPTDYLDEDGNIAMVMDASGQLVLPKNLSNLQEFLAAWQPSWAEALLPFHPEYCYLEWCDRDEASFDYDVELAEITTYNEAVSKGYMSSTFPLDPLLILNKDPYFTQPSGLFAGGGGAALSASMKGYITAYYQASPTSPVYSMLEAAVWAELLKYPVYPHYGNNPSVPNNVLFSAVQDWIDGTVHPANAMIEDTVWHRFRAMYLGKKEQLQYNDRWNFAMNTCTNSGGYNECIDQDYFNFLKNGFGTWNHNGKFFTPPLQTCSWPYYSLYKDKAIRFPSVYNVPVDFDPYAPPSTVIPQFEDWASGKMNSICDTCACPNKALTQLANWVLTNKLYLNTNLNNNLIVLPASLPFLSALQLQVFKCFGLTVTQVSVTVTSDFQNLGIGFYTNNGTFLFAFSLQSTTPNAFEIATGISCIKFIKSEDGYDTSEAFVSTIYGQTLPVTVITDPPCYKSACNDDTPDCPISDLGRDLSQILNALIARDSLIKTVKVNRFINTRLKGYFTPIQNIQGPITWTGQLSGSTINATLSSNQVSCKFTLELPSNLNASNLQQLGPILAVTPDITQIDPATGYTYHALIKVTKQGSTQPLIIKVQSSCFPFSYCLKCPPVASNTKITRSAKAESRENAKKAKSGTRTPGPILGPTPIDPGDLVDIKIDTSGLCHPCTPDKFTLTYDYLKPDSTSGTGHIGPPIDACDPCKWPKDTALMIPIPNPCLDQQVMAAYANAANAYQQYLDSLARSIRNGYVRHCMNARETFTMQYMDALHHFTLYYYDQANNLIKTIPPDGVKPLSQTSTLQAIQYMNNPNSGINPVTPVHGMPSEYTYNSLNQLRRQRIPDHDAESVFYYDYLSRIVISQNAEQAKVDNQRFRYSYTLYDGLNRPKETGELVKVQVATKMTDAIARDSLGLLTWIATKNKREVTTTQYDEPLPGIPSLYFNGNATNYRNRVASVTYQELEGSPVENSTYYLYDIHGNVKEVVQNVFELGAKKIQYDYDLISGNVKKVYYQRGEVDQFLHWYEYDVDNRITDVRTSFDGFVWDHDAEYFYCKHGPLARTELGEHKVQGVDFAYTIQGWIKGVNSGILNEKVDIGQDGVTGHPHGSIPGDAFGYMLRYHKDDYRMIGAAPAGLGWEPADASNKFHQTGRDLYNGNIQNMITAIGEPVNSGFRIKPLGYAYTYDQLNRIRSMNAYEGLNQSLNNWNAGIKTKDYATTYTYDGNGNLQALSRNGEGSVQQMDDFKYHYAPGRNQLDYVNDAVAAGNYPEDIDNQSPGNYRYDAIGNLIRDNDEHLTFGWNVAGKIKFIQKTATSELIKFHYDPSGKRVIKSLTNALTNKTESTYYVLDATGNVMSIYTKEETPPLSTVGFTWESAFIYGSSRIGEERIDTNLIALATIQNIQNDTWYSYRSRGSKYFELGNHLGNVLATVSDRNLAIDLGGDKVVDGYTADIWTVSDYFPFGSPMPERTFSNGDYKFGFNGKENDNEVRGNGNYQDYGLRGYDSRLARFFSVDPLTQKYPWYTPFQFAGNKPIQFIDLDGGEEKEKTKNTSIAGEEESKGKPLPPSQDPKSNQYILPPATNLFFTQPNRNSTENTDPHGNGDSGIDGKAVVIKSTELAEEGLGKNTKVSSVIDKGLTMVEMGEKVGDVVKAPSGSQKEKDAKTELDKYLFKTLTLTVIDFTMVLAGVGSLPAMGVGLFVASWFAECPSCPNPSQTDPYFYFQSSYQHSLPPGLQAIPK